MAIATRILRIGNSRGIRVAEALLKQAKLPEAVEIHAEPGRLVVKAAHRARAGWADAALLMRQRDEDRLLSNPPGARFDRKEWGWR